MRIIGGLASSIPLKAPHGLDVRPTTDRVKESLFGILGDLRELKVLDLYAGSGALGLEALSRGAASVVFVEKNSRHLRFLEDNLAIACRSIGGDARARVRVLRGDVRLTPRLLPEDAGTFDIIIADPPYEPGPGEYGADAMLKDAAFAAWAGPQALLVLEHALDSALPWHPLSSWQLRDLRRYHNTAIALARQVPPG